MRFTSMRIFLIWLCGLMCLAACARRAGDGAPPPPLPHYDLWVQRMQDRAPPANAAALMPSLQAAFAAEGVPPELAWMAELESGLDADARGLWGTRGLFQLSRDAARALGLSTFLPDDRLDPGKSAHAVGRRLRVLGQKYSSWPLALAAYNAGEGRVDRAIAVMHTHYFGIVAEGLPTATRRYVPAVLALVAVRTGVTPEQLPAPALQR
jgi:membrane-bound lytic murein transglycosylase D